MLNIFKLIIISASLFTSNLYATSGGNWGKTIRIYNKLIEVNYLKPARKLILIEDGDLNAWVVKNDNMYVTTKLIKLTNAELALVLGHELAHIQQGDAKHKNSGGKLEEDRADYWGRIYAHNIGYNQCKMSYLFVRLYKNNGNQGGELDPHSSNLKRFWRIYKHCNEK